MLFNRRRAVCTLLLIAGIVPAHFSVAANNIPPGPVRIIAPFVAGGTADVLARIIGQRLGSKYNQPFVVENKPGMGGNLGAGAVATSKADGSTLLLGTIGIHSAYSIYNNLQYNPEKDLQPVVILGGVPCVVAVNPSRPYKNLKELMSYAKANPGALTFGSAGTGSSTHMAGELFQQATGIKLTHVPYKGSAQAMNDLIGGQIDMMFELLTTAVPFVKTGKIRGLAVTSVKRNSELPDLPSVSEVAVPGFEASGWFTVAAPSGVSKEAVAQYNKDINEILRAPDLQAKWQGLALDVIGGSPEEARNFIAGETVKWKKVIQVANIKTE